MLPPCPPSPPDGPPLGTYFSRRNATQPFPPSPPLTNIFASSTNTALFTFQPAGDCGTAQYPQTSIPPQGSLSTPLVRARIVPDRLLRASKTKRPRLAPGPPKTLLP